MNQQDKNLTKNSSYERKISSEEAREGYFLVLKNRLSFFPKIGSSFSVKSGTEKKKTKVESYHCECQGPQLPHEHYYICWAGLVQGNHLTVKKILDHENLYSISIKE
jgi:hypothetical protein